MHKTFAHGLGDLAGDDIRRWHADHPVSEKLAVPRGGGWMRVIGTMVTTWRCRRPMRRTLALRPVLVSDPSSTHVPFRPHKPT